MWLRKTRPILDIHRRLQALYQRRKEDFEKLWKPWCKASKSVGEFWGKRTPVEGFSLEQVLKSNPFRIRWSDDGYSPSGICESDKEDLLKIIDPKELPLLINDQYWNGTHLVEDLLKGKGKIKPSVFRQDLIDEYLHLEHKSNHLYHLMGLYENILIRHITDTYYQNIGPSWKNHWAKLIVYQIESHSYYLVMEQNPKLISTPYIIKELPDRVS